MSKNNLNHLRQIHELWHCLTPWQRTLLCWQARWYSLRSIIVPIAAAISALASLILLLTVTLAALQSTPAAAQRHIITLTALTGGAASILTLVTVAARMNPLRSSR
ncbi:hypothetical protein D6833_09150 [Candidatus Parcubacteria bacterium]|nr:MAG: hypothetical protein D6833_09150 [Candidatus Parcubacteria bacterium]